MAEARRRAAARALVPCPRGGTGGLFVRRVVSPSMAAAADQVRRPWTGPAVGKENMMTPPSGYCGFGVRSRVRVRVRGRKSPLPQLHPRTPLRDISAIVKSIERCRSRLRAAAAVPLQSWEDLEAAAKPQQPDQDSSSTQAEHTTTVQTPQEQCAPTTDSTTAEDANGTKGPGVVPTTPIGPVADEERAVIEERLSNSIETIEKLVMKSAKKAKKQQPSKREAQVKILRLMR